MQATRRTYPFPIGLALAAALAVLLAGCQPDAEPPENSTDEAAAASTPEPAESDGAPAVASRSNPGEQATAAPGPDQCALTVGWDPWEPYHYLAIGGELQGLDVEIVRAVAAEADCELDFLQGGWDSLMRLLRAGELDMMLGATRTESREEWARFSMPYRSESFRLYALERMADDYAGRDLETLLEEGFRLGVTQGYYYGPEVNALLERPEYADRILEAAVGELNFTWLLDMQIDGFIEDPFVAAAIERRRRDTEPIVALPAELGSGPVTFMFSRSSVSEDIVDRFDDGIEALEDSGRHQQLLDQYLQYRSSAGGGQR